MERMLDGIVPALLTLGVVIGIVLSLAAYAVTSCASNYRIVHIETDAATPAPGKEP